MHESMQSPGLFSFLIDFGVHLNISRNDYNLNDMHGVLYYIFYERLHSFSTFKL